MTSLVPLSPPLVPVLISMTKRCVRSVEESAAVQTVLLTSCVDALFTHRRPIPIYLVPYFSGRSQAAAVLISGATLKSKTLKALDIPFFVWFGTKPWPAILISILVPIEFSQCPRRRGRTRFPWITWSYHVHVHGSPCERSIYMSG